LTLLFCVCAELPKDFCGDNNHFDPQNQFCFGGYQTIDKCGGDKEYDPINQFCDGGNVHGRCDSGEWDEWVELIAPTCITPGTKRRRCKTGGGYETAYIDRLIDIRCAGEVIWDATNCAGKTFETWYAFAENISTIVPPAVPVGLFDSELCAANGHMSMETVGYIDRDHPDNSSVGFGFVWLHDGITTDIRMADGIFVTYSFTGESSKVSLMLRSSVDLEHDEFEFSLTPAVSRTVDIAWSDFAQAGWSGITGDINEILQKSQGFQFTIPNGNANFTIHKIEWR